MIGSFVEHELGQLLVDRLALRLIGDQARVVERLVGLGVGLGAVILRRAGLAGRCRNCRPGSMRPLQPSMKAWYSPASACFSEVANSVTLIFMSKPASAAIDWITCATASVSGALRHHEIDAHRRG